MNPKCKLCCSETDFVFNAEILKKYEINYYHCENCDYIFTEEPYWLDEAYINPINRSDTGIILRNIQQVLCTSALCFFVFGRNKNFLDFGAGTGLFVRAMRDVGFNFYYFDKYPSNIFAKGLEHTNERIDLVTSFETFEHFNRPLEEIEKLLKYSDSILFSTLLHQRDIVPEKDWWYYGFEHGQHISFYSIKTLEYLAEKYKLRILSDGKGSHLLTRKKINKYLVQILQNKVFCLMTFPIIKLLLKSKKINT